MRPASGAAHHSRPCAVNQRLSDRCSGRFLPRAQASDAAKVDPELMAKAMSAQDPEKLSEAIMYGDKEYILGTYARAPVIFSAGQGCRLFDVKGRTYLDFAAGIAVNSLGHSDDRWLRAVVEQASTLTHTSNLYYTIPQVVLAQMLVEQSFADKVFFCNSGTEANEAAIKFARKFARVQAGVDPYDEAAEAPHELVSFSASFHGRTMGALALTAKQQYKTPFLPGMPGAVSAEFCNLDSAAEAIRKAWVGVKAGNKAQDAISGMATPITEALQGKTAAVFVEPVQGEGGVNVATTEFLRGVRELCDEAGALLVFDEVQCGLGRTGRLWGHELFGVQPDMMTLAKPLAGGLPIGAVLLAQKVADAMQPGDHGSTFAGSPVVCNAAQTVMEIISDPVFLKEVERKGDKLKQGLQDAVGSSPHVKEVRGVGLIVGVQLDQPAGPVCTAAMERGLLVITAGAGDVVRMVPPLTTTDADIEECCSILAECISQLQ